MWQLEFKVGNEIYWIPWHDAESLEAAVQRASDYVGNYPPNHAAYSAGRLQVRIVERDSGEVIPVEALGI